MRWIYGLLFFTVTMAFPVLAQDAAPTPEAPPATEAVAAPEAAPTPDTAAALAALGINLNIVWTLLAGFLVMFMQTGFAMVETGFTRAKNVAHTMSMNFMVYTLALFGYWICGFAIQFGGTGALTSVSPILALGPEVTAALNSEWGLTIGGNFWGIMGTKGFFLAGDNMYFGGIFALFLFQMVFMDTTATVPTGAMAERWKFSTFAIYAVVVGAIIYPLFGNWVWGGGFLAALGKNLNMGHGLVDFAGSSVVHLCGGVLALVGAKILGPRYGKYNSDGTINAIPPHNIPMAMMGTFILAFGWFGFNPGSTLAGTDTQIGIIATNTMLASMSGAIVGMLITWVMFGKPDPSFMCNGMLAGLVAITAPCAFVDAWAAVLIGAVSGVLVLYAARFVEETLRIDDPVGAVAVHGFNGAWGILALGLFANGKYGNEWNSVKRPEFIEKFKSDGVRGAFFGDLSQLWAQCIGIATCVVAVGIMGYILFKILDLTIGMRTDVNDEIYGLDIPEMGVAGYQADVDPEPK